MKIDHCFLRRIILMVLMCPFTLSTMAQRINPDSLNFRELNQYWLKAEKMRKTGKTLTLGGAGLVLVSNVAGFSIASIPPKDPDENPWGGGFVPGLLIVIIGTCIGTASTVAGIPFWAIGANRKGRAEIALRKFDFKKNDTMAVGIGITLRF